MEVLYEERELQKGTTVTFIPDTRVSRFFESPDLLFAARSGDRMPLIFGYRN